jgi:hypothetical protein
LFCNESFCLECRQHFLQCRRCSKVACGGCVSAGFQVCGECEVPYVYCKECCDFEECQGCGLKVCERHDTLIDCSKCQIRHCRDCEHVERCRLCQKACYDGGCSCEDARPTKRMKRA